MHLLIDRIDVESSFSPPIVMTQDQKSKITQTLISYSFDWRIRPVTALKRNHHSQLCCCQSSHRLYDFIHTQYTNRHTFGKPILTGQKFCKIDLLSPSASCFGLSRNYLDGMLWIYCLLRNSRYWYYGIMKEKSRAEMSKRIRQEHNKITRFGLILCGTGITLGMRNFFFLIEFN